MTIKQLDTDLLAVIFIEEITVHDLPNQKETLRDSGSARDASLVKFELQRVCQCKVVEIGFRRMESNVK